MAKWFDCCGGHGRHAEGCEVAEAIKGTGLVLPRTPGKTQARLLDNIKNGRLPRRPPRDTVRALAVMIERGWVERNPDGTFEVTKAGAAAAKLKSYDPPAGSDRNPLKVPRNACMRCGGRKTIPGPKRSWITCPSCNGSGTR